MLLTWRAHATTAGPPTPLTAMEGEVEQTASSPWPSAHKTLTLSLLGMHPWRSPPGVLCRGASQWDVVWGPPFPQMHDRQQSWPRANHLRRHEDFSNSSSSLWQSRETNRRYFVPRFGNAIGIYVPTSGILWLWEDLTNFQPETGVGEIKVNPFRLHRKAKEIPPKKN